MINNLRINKIICYNHDTGGQNLLIYITGDTHGKFNRIFDFYDFHIGLSEEDILIILGDAGINFYGGVTDIRLKRKISKLPLTIFCIHGNHEMRPESIPTYHQKIWNGGLVHFEDAFPKILFAQDGEIFKLNKKECIVIGGAYSIDKFYRLYMKHPWFKDEQPSEEIKQYVESNLMHTGWKIDTVLSHTCPLKYEPTEVFLNFVDQSEVDKSTEIWLDEIENKLT